MVSIEGRLPKLKPARRAAAEKLIELKKKENVDAVHYFWVEPLIDSIEFGECSIEEFGFADAVKNFTTAEGGASTWCLPQSVYDNGVTDEEIYKMYQLLSLHYKSLYIAIGGEKIRINR